MRFAAKHHRWVKFGPKHHPLHHEKLGNENGQVKNKAARWELNGVIVPAPRSRKNPCRIGV